MYAVCTVALSYTYIFLSRCILCISDVCVRGVRGPSSVRTNIIYLIVNDCTLGLQQQQNQRYNIHAEIVRDG